MADSGEEPRKSATALQAAIVAAAGLLVGSGGGISVYRAAAGNTDGIARAEYSAHLERFAMSEQRAERNEIRVGLLERAESTAIEWRRTVDLRLTEIRDAMNDIRSQRRR